MNTDDAAALELAQRVPEGWRGPLSEALSAPDFAALARFVSAERRELSVYPPPEMVFAALAHTDIADVKVVILGQDPYHGEGQAHGLSFSVRPGVAVPPSLRNIFKELEDDLGVGRPSHGCLSHWADQGVLLLNTVLTVRAAEANSHQRRGWEGFTDAVLAQLDKSGRPLVFVLWGSKAIKKARFIDAGRHVVLSSPHPSPLSAYRGFFGSRPFSGVNEALERLGQVAIDWRIPDL